jgi:hypothetical protein
MYASFDADGHLTSSDAFKLEDVSDGDAQFARTDSDGGGSIGLFSNPAGSCSFVDETCKISIAVGGKTFAFNASLQGTVVIADADDARLRGALTCDDGCLDGNLDAFGLVLAYESGPKSGPIVRGSEAIPYFRR